MTEEKEEQLAYLRNQLRLAEEAQRFAEMSDNWYFTNGRKKKDDDDIRILKERIRKLEEV